MDIFVFIIILFLAIAFVFILPVYAGFKLWSKGKYTKYFVAVFLTGYFFMWFRAFYPEDAFYIEHFGEITGVDFNENIKVIEKSATYPDMTGDYHVCAIMMLSEKDINLLAMVKLYSYKKVDPSKASSGPCLNSDGVDLKYFYFKDVAGEIIYWGYNPNSRIVYFSYYSL